jgi:hypothetical protein
MGRARAPQEKKRLSFQKVVVLPVAFSAVVLLAVAALHLQFSPRVARVEAAALTEVRGVGRVVHEETLVMHQWENNYVEVTEFVLHLEGSAKEGVVAAIERRLELLGWRVSDRERSEIWLESAAWPYVIVSVESLKSSGVQVNDRGLPLDEMAFLSVMP